MRDVMQPPTGQPPPGKRWHTREDSGIRLDARMRWWHDDEPILHPKIIELFNASLVLDDADRYQLRIGNDWCFIQVEGAAYEVRTVDVTPDERVSVRLSDRTAEALDVASLHLGADGVLSCRVKQGRAQARLSRDAQYQLGQLLEEGPDGGLVLNVGQRKLAVPVELDALASSV
ncbi:hypothetical protein BHS06_06805 [Myxococcus xanthus]|nr:hypothetical protein BHS06_06805 [Myxococcus xanthus]